MRRLRRERRQALGLEILRPWDLEVDPLGRDPLRPFSGAAELVGGVTEIFTRVDPELGGQFRSLDAEGLLDLESRKGKAPGGYQSTMQERRVPFIFMNAVGLDSDVRVLLHEGGHAFHMLAARGEPLIDYRNAPLEFAEVASMAMELLAAPHLDVFYDSQADAARSYREMLERTIMVFPWVATIDAFQHWIYTHPGHSRADREEAWIAVFRRFAPEIDYGGREEVEASLWHRQLHLFLVPFYYVEYAIAELGALQVWRGAARDGAAAVRRYRDALALGGSRPLPELFAAAGAEFDFTEKTLAPLMSAIAEEMAGTRA